MPVCCYNGHLYLEHAEVVREKNRTKGLKLHLYTEGMYLSINLKKQIEKLNSVKLRYNKFLI